MLYFTHMWNIHPIIVHFPIALLFVYAVLEIAQKIKLRNKSWYKTLKLGFLYIGTVFGFLALQSGGIAEHIVGETSVVETHGFFGTMTTWIFSILSIIYLLPEIHSITHPLFKKLQRICMSLQKITILLAILGLITLTITGALGGAISHGPDTDPIVSLIYSLFIK